MSNYAVAKPQTHIDIFYSLFFIQKIKKRFFTTKIPQLTK
ncbi:Hypothetical protein BN2458_PEG1563 [Helicobacter typhlonius]|uniref:Uncharacterized protein n=1 Tax=Helicobacter typhlonius TaxID=76936 RepID=A0A0S4PZ11_9HELI|nr:Hypothetical protein BN2458_PEG1563 [Helicobacter typhlonius]